MAGQHVTAVQETGGEKEILIGRLNQGRDRYLIALQGVAETSAGWRNAEGRWSILECAEHVAVAEEQMLRMWEKLAAPGSSDRAKDAALLAVAHDRTKKNKAPERSEPKGRCATLAEARDRFKAARERTLAFAGKMSVQDLRSKVVPHPRGELDGYQLLTLMAMHPERHALQIEEIKSDPGFPGAR